MEHAETEESIAELSDEELLRRIREKIGMWDEAAEKVRQEAGKTRRAATVCVDENRDALYIMKRRGASAILLSEFRRRRERIKKLL